MSSPPAVSLDPIVWQALKQLQSGVEALQMPSRHLLYHIIVFVQSDIFVTRWFGVGLDESRTRRIDTDTKIVLCVVLMTIDGTIAYRSFARIQPCKQSRPLQHIDVIVRPIHAK